MYNVIFSPHPKYISARSPCTGFKGVVAVTVAHTISVRNCAPGFTCDSCPKGYYESWVAKKQVCTDLDDCTANPCGAGALSCQNKPGVSHKCTCKAGFTAAYHCGDMPAAKLTTYLAKFGLAFAGDCAALVATYGCKGTLLGQTNSTAIVLVYNDRVKKGRRMSLSPSTFVIPL